MSLRIATHAYGLATGSLKAWIEHRDSSKGAALAFYTVFATTPILLLVIVLAGRLFDPATAQGEVFSRLRGLVGPAGAEAIERLLVAARGEHAGVLATIVSGAVLLFAATSVFAELKDSLDDVWGVEEPLPSGGMELVRTRLLSFVLVLVLASFLVVCLLVSAALVILEAGAGAGWTASAGWRS